MSIKMTISREVELEPLELPETVFQHPDEGEPKGTNLTLTLLGQAAADKLTEDYLARFYRKADLRNPWTRRNFR